MRSAQPAQAARTRSFGSTLQWGVAFASAAAVLWAGAGPAAADATYHTERLEFVAVGGAPLRGGAVVNAHANGPQRYAHEQYTLVGARPATAYQVRLLVDVDGPTCTAAPDITVATDLTTNAAGTGTASRVFTPAEVGGLTGTVRGRWQVTLKGSSDVHYQTACTAITLD